MGKIKKNKDKKCLHYNPLDEQINEEKFAKLSTRTKHRVNQEDEKFVNSKLSKKIIQQVREQQKELGESSSTNQNVHNLILTLGEPDDDEDEGEDDLCSEGSDFMEEVKIDEEEERALEMFMCKDPVKKATLADIIKEKLTEKETEVNTMFSDVQSMKPEDLQRIRPIYKGVAAVLSRYRSGKIPKAFKVIPKFSNWEDILYLTEPDRWSAAAMFEATKLFASNLGEKMAQRFYNLVLLPRLRDDIAESKVLNVCLYQALRKSIFKPAAFFKGIILPLCEGGDCTLREATIFGSIIARNSIPVLHASAAILKITEMPFCGVTSIMLRVLLEKKFGLPYRVIDGVVDYFLRFIHDKRKMPLMWHQSLLTFAQNYKDDISEEQKNAIYHLLRVQSHHHVSPEVRKELQSGRSRYIPPKVNVDESKQNNNLQGKMEVDNVDESKLHNVQPTMDVDESKQNVN